MWFILVVMTAPTIVASRSDTASPAELRRRELAGFLRSRRERIAPEQVGMPAAGRRRTPGLRREEVAQLAGVGITWYTWLEQGRDINVSEQVLEAIARTLMLDPHERSHLFTLAGSPLTAIESESQAVSPEAHAILAKLDPYPAIVTNGRYDLLAYNRAYQVLIGDVDVLPFEDRNTMWLMFMSSTMRTCLVDRDHAKARVVAQYPRCDGRARRRAGLEVLGQTSAGSVARVRRPVAPARRRNPREHAQAVPAPGTGPAAVHVHQHVARPGSRHASGLLHTRRSTSTRAAQSHSSTNSPRTRSYSAVLDSLASGGFTAHALA